MLRRHKNSENFKRDQQAFSILSSNPSSMYRKIKEMKNSTTKQIQMLKVGTKEYHGEDVKNGFFQSISDLKTREIEAGNETLSDQMDDYRNILDICKMKRDLPNISLIDSTNILREMKANVNDIYCVTTLHYINAGNFNFLLNCIQYVIQRPMPSFNLYYLQPKDIDLCYILLPKAKLSRFSVLALAFLPIFWFYNSSPIFMLLGLALLAFFS